MLRSIAGSIIQLGPQQGVSLSTLKSLQRNARALRVRATDAERRLWYLLRSRRIGAKFRRQHPLGSCIVDFVCLQCRLVIEVDGGHHQEQAEADRRRDDALRSRGFIVLRFWDNDVLVRTSEVLEQIWATVQKRRPSPPPLSREAGEGSDPSDTPVDS